MAIIVKVRIGEHDSNRQDETFLETKDLELKNFIVHEEYKHNSKLRHDIALLELEEEVDLTVYTPVCLARAGITESGENIIYIHLYLLHVKCLSVIAMCTPLLRHRQRLWVGQHWCWQ